MQALKLSLNSLLIALKNGMNKLFLSTCIYSKIKAKEVKAMDIKNSFKTMFIKAWWVKTMFIKTWWVISMFKFQSHVPLFFVYAKLLDVF